MFTSVSPRIVPPDEEAYGQIVLKSALKSDERSQFHSFCKEKHRANMTSV